MELLYQIILYKTCQEYIYHKPMVNTFKVFFKRDKSRLYSVQNMHKLYYLHKLYIFIIKTLKIIKRKDAQNVNQI